MAAPHLFRTQGRKIQKRQPGMNNEDETGPKPRPSLDMRSCEVRSAQKTKLLFFMVVRRETRLPLFQAGVNTREASLITLMRCEMLELTLMIPLMIRGIRQHHKT